MITNFKLSIFIIFFCIKANIYAWLYINRLHFDCAMICIVVFINYIIYYSNAYIKVSWSSPIWIDFFYIVLNILSWIADLRRVSYFFNALFNETNLFWLIYELINALGIKTSMLFNLCCADNTILLCFFTNFWFWVIKNVLVLFHHLF